MKPWRSAVRAVILLSIAGGVSTAARADEGSNVGVDLNVGILTGIGADVAVPINPYLGVRLTASSYSYNRNGTNYGTSVAWNASLKLADQGLLLDVYPFAGAFHVTAGIVHDGTKIDVVASPSNSITFNGTTYPAGEVGSASGEVAFKSSVPYLGLGFGNLGGSKGFHFIADFGVLLTGKPTASLNATCGASLPSLGCTQLQSDVAAERAKMQDNVNKLDIWPAIRFGIGYSF